MSPSQYNPGYAPEDGSGFKLLKWKSEKLMEYDESITIIN